jgi:uncharacterized protein (DUF433 family)
MDVHYEKVITVEPGKRGGKPCVRGMRIKVYDVLSYLASGMSREEVLGDFPKVLRVRLGNCTTSEIEEVLRSRRHAVESLERDVETDILELW